MAQIRSKQIKDFLSTVNWATVGSADIANAADTKAYVDAAQLTANTSINTRLTTVEGNLATEIDETNSEVSRLDGQLADDKRAMDDALALHAQGNVESFQSSDARIGLVEDDVEAILLASEADKDSFAEIVSLVNAVDAATDNDVAKVVSDLNKEIGETNSEVNRLDQAIADNAKDSNDALALHAQANVLSFQSSDSRIGIVEGDLADEVARATSEEARIEGRLDGEIDATNSEVVRLDLAVEKTAKDASDALALHAEANVKSFQSSDERIGIVESDLADEIAATDAEVASIDVRFEKLKTDTGADLATHAQQNVESFQSSDNRIGIVEADLSTEIRETNSEVNRLDGAISTTAKDAADALAAHAQANVESFGSSDARIGLVEDDVEAILLASEADKDSFAEIVSLVNAVDAATDNDVAKVVSDLNKEIGETNSEVNRLDQAIADNAKDSQDALALHAQANVTSFQSSDSRIGVVEGDLADEITRATSEEARIEGRLNTEIDETNSEVARLDQAIEDEETRATTEEAALAAAIAALETKSDANDSDHGARLAELEATIVKDVEMFEEVKPGDGFTYTLTHPVQDGNKDLVDVFVNGHRVRIDRLDGQVVTLVDPNYAIDAQDEVFFLYQK